MTSAMRRYLLPGFMFQSVVIAGGYGTGRELVEYFLSHGPLGGLLAMAVSTVVWSVVCVAAYEFARTFKTFEYRSFFQRLLGPAWFLFEILYVTMMMLVLAVIAASAGEILYATFGLPRLVGVIAPNNRVRKRYLHAIRESSASVELDNGCPRIETFHGSRRPEVRFDRGGILVINAQACKGLEFDTVVLADIEEHRVDAANRDRTRKLFYVMVSRARRNVVMFMKCDANPTLEQILPTDEAVLSRRPLPRPLWRRATSSARPPPRPFRCSNPRT